MQIEINDKVKIKSQLSFEDENTCYTVTGKTYDRENNVMFELEDEDGFLLEDVYYPSQLIKIQED